MRTFLSALHDPKRVTLLLNFLASTLSKANLPEPDNANEILAANKAKPNS